jgi:YegS/Rv2252/BmrU family lipid kinase
MAFTGKYNGGIAQFRQPVLIYNPAAGRFRRNPEAILQRTKAALARAGWQPELLPTAMAGHADELARVAVARGADLVLVLGGDGTINEVVQGLAHSDVPLGVLPGGTANCLAMELALGKNIDRAAERLASCEPVQVALGRVTADHGLSRYFLLMCGIGLDAAIVDEVDLALKAKTGKLAYWVAGLAQFRRRVAPVEMLIDGSRQVCGFALVSRIRNYGGDLEIARGASLRNNDFEVVWFEGSHPLRYGAYMLGVGARQVQNMPGVHTVRASRVEIRAAAPVQVDGEFLGRAPFRMEAVPGALRLLIPPAYG